jgi:hypothetical protein
VLKQVLLVISILFLSAFIFPDARAADSSCTEIAKTPEKGTDLLTFPQKIKSWSANSHTPPGAFHKKDQSNSFKSHVRHAPTSSPLITLCLSLARSFSARSLLYRLMLFPKHYFW